jgi:hypothetical protein
MRTRLRDLSRLPLSLVSDDERFKSGKRLWQKPTYHRLYLEPLEDRTLLSGISAMQATAIDNGLSALAGLGTQLNSFEQFSQQIKILNNAALSQVLDIGQTFTNDLSNAASSYLAANANAAATALATALSATPGVTVTGSQDMTGNLTFTVVLDVKQSDNGITLNLGDQASALGVRGTGSSTDVALTVNLSVELTANFSFTVSADSAMPADDFELTFNAMNPLALTGTVSATNVSANLDIGFLSAQVSGGTVNLTAGVAATITGTQPFSVSALGNSPGSLLSVTPTTSLMASLPVSATVGSFSPSGTLTVTDNDLFGSTVPSVSFDSNFGTNFVNFTNLNADQVLANLNNLAGFLSKFSGSSILSTPIPFAKGQTLGSVINLGTAFASQLGLTTDPSQVMSGNPLEQVQTEMGTQAVAPTFSTIQDLVSDLAKALNVNSNTINVVYDSTAQELTVGFDLKFNAPEINVPLAFNLSMAPLGGVSSSAQLDVKANGEIQFTFGFDLSVASGGQNVALSTPNTQNVPSSLADGDGHFQLSINGGALTGTVTVSSSGISSPQDIVNNINTGLSNAGITNVTAMLIQGGEIPMSNPIQYAQEIALEGDSSVSSLQLFAASSDSMVKDLGYQSGESAHAHSGAIFVNNASLSGTATLSVSNLSAVASLGPISIHASGGSISGTAGFSASLTDPSNMNSTKIPLADLLKAITGTISSTFASPNITGSATLTLPNIAVDAGLLTLSGSPMITVAVSDLGKSSPTVMVTQSGDLLNSSLFNFESLSFDTIFHDVTNALVQLKNLVSNYSAFGFLNTKLPVINTSVASLIDYAGKLGTDLANVQEDPNGTLQELTSELNMALGGDAGGPISVSFDPAADALRLDLSFHIGTSASLPLNLDLKALGMLASGNPLLGTVGSLLSASSSGNLTVKADATAALSFGFDLSKSFAPFVDSSPGHMTAITVGANISTPGGVNVSLNVGPVGLAVKMGMITLNDGSSDTTKEATFSFGLSSGKHYLTSLSTSDFQATLKGGASLSLPLYLEPGDTPLGGAGSNTLSITIADLNALLQGTAGSVQITTPDLTNLFGNLSVLGLLQNPSVFLNGITGILTTLQGGLNSQIFSVNLPLLGNDLQKAATFLSGLVSDATSGLTTLSNTLKNDTLQNLIGDLQQGIFQVFGPSGLKILEKADGTPATDKTDVMINFFDAQGNNLGLMPADPSKEDAIQLNIKLGSDLVNSSFSVASNIGLPGLGLSTSGNIKIDLPWTFNFGIGFSVHDGVYLDTSTPTFDIHLTVTAPGLNLTGHLAFLALSAMDGTAAGNTNFTGEFKVSMLDPNNDGKKRLPLTYLLSGGDLSKAVSATFTADAELHLHLTAGFGNNTEFPSLGADLDISWMFDSNNGLSGGGMPTVDFHNITLDLGTFISKFAGPIIQDIDNIIDPVEPVLDVLTARLPIISDLAGQDISLLSLAASFFGDGQISQSDVDTFVSIYHLVKMISDITIPSSGTVMIPLGSFDLGSQDVRNTQTQPLQAKDMKPTDTKTEVDNSGASPAAIGFVDMVSMASASFGTMGGGISFPILTDPSKIFGLFLGQTADLVDFSLPKISGGFTYTQTFPIFGPLVAVLQGTISFTAQVSGGYDTTGLQELVKNPTTDPGQIASDLLDGFFLNTKTPFLIISGGISAGVALDLGIIDAGVSGGIFATANFNFYDPNKTGKLRFGDIAQITDNGTMPECLFDITGNLEFRLFAYLDINLLFFSIHDQFTIADINLVSFSVGCVRAPVLATPTGNGVLRLNMGPYAGARLNGDTKDDNENFKIDHVGGTLGHENVNVTYNGTTQEYDDVSKIVGDGGAGDNSITIDSGVTSECDLTISHSTGTDTIVDHGSGPLFVNGGPGTNSITHDGSGTGTLSVSGNYDYDLTNGMLTLGPGGTGVGTDTFTGISNVDLTGGGGNTFNVTGYGANAILTGGSGANKYNINDAGMGSNVTIKDPANPGSVATVNGFSNSYTITSSLLTDGTDKVNYDGNLLTLILNGATGNDTFLITSTLAGSTTVNTGNGTEAVNIQGTNGSTTINTGNGTSTVDVGSNAPSSGGILDHIQGGTTINGGSGGSTTLNVDDTGSGGSKTGTLTGTTLKGLGMGMGGITYSNIAVLHIALGSGGNSFTIMVDSMHDLPPLTTVDGGSAMGGPNSLTATFAQDFNGTLLLTDFQKSTISVMRDFNGFLSDTMPGTVQLITIGRSLTVNAQLIAGSIDTMTVMQDLAGMVQVSLYVGTMKVGGFLSGTVTVGTDFSTLSVGQDLSGTVTVGGNLGTATIGGSVSGLIKVGGNFTMMSVGVDVSGKILVTGNFGTATIGGSVSGLIQVGGNFDMLSVGLDVSGSILVTGTLNKTMIGRSVTPTGQIIAGAINTMSVGVDVAGLIQALGNFGTLSVGHSVTNLGIVKAGGNFNLMTVGPMAPMTGDDMAGQVIVGGTLGKMWVAGGTPGNITAGMVGTVGVYLGYGPYVLQVNEGGIQRRVEAAVPGQDYPLFHFPNPKLPVPQAPSPAGVTIQYFYEGLASQMSPALTNPQLTARVTNATPMVDEFDLSLTVWSDTAKFNLCRLDANGASGLRNVAVEGDVLAIVSAMANNFLPPPTGDRPGVYLPADVLASVGVRNNVTNGAVTAKSIQAVAFGSLTDASGTTLGTNANQVMAQEVLTLTTPIVQANDTFRVPFADNLTVALFLDTTTGGVFDGKDVLFTDQVANDARGAVTALVSAAISNSQTTITTIALNGDGGAIQTQQDISQLITSTGPLGDLILKSMHGLVASVTAPSIIGNIIATSGSLGSASIVQTTGIRTDPITGLQASIPADFGRLLKDANGNVTGVTMVQLGGGGIAGELISRNNFVSLISTGGGISGVIAAKGDLGAATIDPATGKLTRFGGILSSGSITGDVLALGNIFEDISVPHGGLKGARIAAQGQKFDTANPSRKGILGNLNFSGNIDGGSAIVSGGMIGDPISGTGISAGNVIGILAADESIKILSANVKGTVFQNAGAPGNPNGPVIDSIFVPKSFDVMPLDLQGLKMILSNLNKLHVGTDGNLTIVPLIITNGSQQNQMTGAAGSGTALLQTVGWSNSVGDSITLGVYVANPDGTLTADEHARIDDAIATLDQTWTGTVGIDLVEVTDPTLATIIISNSPTSAAGGQANGVLGCTTLTFAPAASGELDEGVTYLQFSGQAVVNLLEGWNWYTGSDPTQIGAGQFDYQSVVTHELGHSVGLYHDVSNYGSLNSDGHSAMYPVLNPGDIHRQLSPYDISWLTHLYANGENPGGNDGPESVAPLMTGSPAPAPIGNDRKETNSLVETGQTQLNFQVSALPATEAITENAVTAPTIPALPLNQAASQLFWTLNQQSVGSMRTVGLDHAQSFLPTSGQVSTNELYSGFGAAEEAVPPAIDTFGDNHDFDTSHVPDRPGETNRWDSNPPAEQSSDKAGSPAHSDALPAIWNDLTSSEQSTSFLSVGVNPFGERIDESAVIPLVALAWLMPMLSGGQESEPEKHASRWMRRNSALGWEQFDDGFDPFALLADKFALTR